MVETNEMHGNVPILDVRIMKSESILGISVGILQVFSDKLFFLISARRQIPLFAIKKDLVRIELTFYQEVSINVSEYEVASMNFLSIFDPRHF